MSAVRDTTKERQHANRRGFSWPWSRRVPLFDEPRPLIGYVTGVLACYVAFTGWEATHTRLIAGDFELLDTQYVTEHLRSFGAVEISRLRYTGLLDKAIKGEADFWKLPIDQPVSGARALAIIAGRG